jgi:hypothetical protein
VAEASVAALAVAMAVEASVAAVLVAAGSLHLPSFTSPAISLMCKKSFILTL